jgi:hypothetical protein
VAYCKDSTDTYCINKSIHILSEENEIQKECLWSLDLPKVMGQSKNSVFCRLKEDNHCFVIPTSKTEKDNQTSESLLNPGEAKNNIQILLDWKYVLLFSFFSGSTGV